MLNRQKVVLAMLRENEGSASRLQVIKWLFLLAQESPSRGGNAFYQFVPYKHGPYSFTFHQEAAVLIRNGFVEAADDHKWCLTDLGRSYVLSLPNDVQRKCREVVRLYGQLSTQKLLESVYRRYPWFTIKAHHYPSRAVSQVTAESAIYTMGYEGLMVDGFLNELLLKGIQRILDVRNNPTSRRFGFHKNTLMRICQNLDLEYHHFPEVGIPSAQRDGLLGMKDYQLLFAAYERDKIPTVTGVIHRLAAMLTEKPSVLVCMEADPSMCHRSRLANAIATHARLPIKHLGWPR